MQRWMRAAGDRLSGSTVGDTLTVAYQTRLMGLAAEASFWAVFALPWLFLGLVAGLSHFGAWFGVDAASQVRDELVGIAESVLTPEAIDELLIPMLDSILLQGRASLGLLSLVGAIWAGSRVVDALVDGMTIVYQREGLRSFVMTRVVSVGLYLALLLGLIVTIPLVIAGPTFLAQIVPGVGGLTSILLTAAEIIVVLVLVVSLYHWAVPHRTRWLADVPGAIIAMILWAIFSWGLRWYFAWLFREGSVYGVISAPIAVMFWMYVTCLSLLLGAALNGAVAIRKGWFTRPEQAEQDEADPGGSATGAGSGAQARPAGVQRPDRAGPVGTAVEQAHGAGASGLAAGGSVGEPTQGGSGAGATGPADPGPEAARG